jgi:thiol-disulfide isomerase/thioredoxin
MSVQQDPVRDVVLGHRRNRSVAAPIMKLQACLLALVLAALASAAAGALEELDVSKATIQSMLTALPADDDILIEFFASWCPACR